MANPERERLRIEGNKKGRLAKIDMSTLNEGSQLYSGQPVDPEAILKGIKQIRKDFRAAKGKKKIR